MEREDADTEGDERPDLGDGNNDSASDEDLVERDNNEEDVDPPRPLPNGHVQEFDSSDDEDDEDEVEDEIRRPFPRYNRVRLFLERVPDTDDDEEDNPEIDLEDRERFDSELPGQHRYLGEGREVGGRTILDEDLVQDLPLLPAGILPGMVLVPGQTLPLMLFHSAAIEMMKTIIATTKTFGVVPLRTDGTITQEQVGTTAEVFEYREASADNPTEVGLRLKARGRQRFRLLSARRQADGNLMAKVVMLTDIVLDDDPLHQVRLASLDRFRLFPAEHVSPPAEASTSSPTSTTTSCFSSLLSGITRSSRVSDRANKPEFLSQPSLKPRPYRCLAPPLTPHPPWIYSLYDTTALVGRVHAELAKSSKIWSAAPVKVPQDPVELSWWVLSNLPLEDQQRSRLLSINSAVQRLRAELSILEKCRVLVCRRCGLQLGQGADIFSMSKEGPQSAFVNPGGAVHETLTLYKAKNLRLHGQPSTDHSWFPGYAWTITECGRCGDHIGWKFTATSRRLSPDKFYGISRRNIVPKLEVPEGETEDESAQPPQNYGAT